MNAESADTGPADLQPARRQASHRRLDDRLLLAADRAAFASVRIQTEHEDPRVGYGEAPLQVRVHDSDQRLELLHVERVRDRTERKMRSRERDAQRLAREQHHRMSGAGELREKLRVTRETHAGGADDALLHGRGHERVRLAAEAKLGAAAQLLEHVSGVRNVEAARRDWGLERYREDLEHTRPMRLDLGRGRALAHRDR